MATKAKAGLGGLGMAAAWQREHDCSFKNVKAETLARNARQALIPRQPLRAHTKVFQEALNQRESETEKK
jgi:hypothetical protein